jgi:hypothetical protein
VLQEGHQKFYDLVVSWPGEAYIVHSIHATAIEFTCNPTSGAPCIDRLPEKGLVFSFYLYQDHCISLMNC